MSFGVKFLDESLLGIQRNDLILLGGLSGGGKTELATHIALSNAKNGKRVVYFALEAEKYEIEMRIIYKHKVSNYLKSGGTIFTNYDRWMSGMAPHLDDVLSGLDDEKFDLRTRYPNGDYGINEFITDYNEVVHNSDLIILDHIHYFDLESDNENKEYKKIIKTIRNEVLNNGKPMIVVSHIKKRDRRYPTIVPDQEDFHGTSDLVKISTKSITLSPQNDFRIMKKDVAGNNSEITTSNGYFTFIRAVKNRRNGSALRHTGAIIYDANLNTYSSGYYIGHQKTENNEVLFQVDDRAPWWATSAF